MGEGRRRRRRSPAAMDDDHISGLPDKLLHDILLRLHSPHAAGRTSVLSGRWRHVWATLPELVFNGTDACDSDDDDSGYVPPAATSFLDSLDGALRAYSSPTIRVLDISLPSCCAATIPARRVQSWLRFASQRLARKLSISMPSRRSHAQESEETRRPLLVLPSNDGAQDISLSLGFRWQLRIPKAGSFMALTDLTIVKAAMEARVVEVLVGSQCPRLKNLNLHVRLVVESDVSIRSGSLEILYMCVTNTGRVEIVCPRMGILSVSDPDASVSEAYISAPKLAELIWNGDASHSRFQFADNSRHLRVLEHRQIAASLMKHFDKVDKLKLSVYIPEGTMSYERFVNDTNELPECGTLLVSLQRSYHGFAPTMLRLLRKCKSFTVSFSCFHGFLMSPCCPLSCLCRLPESCKADDINLDSLEEVGIGLYEGSHEEVEFVKQLSRCNAALLKKVEINYYNTSVNKRLLCAKVRSVCRPNIEVKVQSP